jgi:hypothetical protein
MNNKKGISALLETVLLILVVLAAAGIVFGAVIPMLRSPAERAAMCQDAVTVNVAQNIVSIIKNKDVMINSISINAYTAAGTATNYVGTVPATIGSVATTTITGTYVKVQVIPVVNTTGGKQVACAPIDVIV